MNKVLLALFLNLTLNLTVYSQVEFSIGTGLSGLRNFSPKQQFWAYGQTLRTNFHFSPKQTAYAWMDYYTDGAFTNKFIATAKPGVLAPSQLPFTATGRLTYRHFSLGWKHYFRGSYAADNGINIYSLAGFGFLFARLSNQLSTAIDTSRYLAPTLPANGTSLKKLTFDAGLGAELPIGGSFFVVADARTWLPASSNTSPYLHEQKNVPLPVMISLGMRVLFGLRY
jgi:hypothetical protein